MPDSSDHKPPVNPRKRHAWAAGFGLVDDRGSKETQDLMEKDPSLETKIQTLTDTNRSLVEAQALRDASHQQILEDSQREIENLKRRVDELEETKRELESKLEEPLLDQEKLEEMVRDDEDFKLRRKHELGRIFSSIRDEHEQAVQEFYSLKLWRESIWKWQRNVDKQDIYKRRRGDDVDNREWTAKDIFGNRENEIRDYRNFREEKQKEVKELEARIEKIEEERIKAWRDVVIGKHGEKEKEVDGDDSSDGSASAADYEVWEPDCESESNSQEPI
jgi:chromosome segregation ATPase